MAYTDDCGFYAAVSEDGVNAGRAVCHPAAACPSPSPNMTSRRDCSPQIVGVEVLLYYPARGVTRSLRSMAAGVSTGPPNRRCRGHGSLLSQSISALKPHMCETSVPWSSTRAYSARHQPATRPSRHPWCAHAPGGACGERRQWLYRPFGRVGQLRGLAGGWPGAVPADSSSFGMRSMYQRGSGMLLSNMARCWSSRPGTPAMTRSAHVRRLAMPPVTSPLSTWRQPGTLFMIVR
jgi:hypothetical protein